MGLDVAFTPETFLGAPAVQSQRASIARVQNGLVSRLVRARRSTIRRFSSIPFLAVEVDETDLQALAGSPEVTDIQLDAVAAPTLAQSTPLIGATKAWAAGYTGAGWTLAVIDTGIDSSHPFLAQKVVAEACFSSTIDGRSSTMCPNGGDTSTLPGAGGPCLLPGCEHGTHVAGIAAGKGTTFSGVAPDATLISIQVFSSFSSSDDCGTQPRPCLLSYTSDQILGLERVYALRSSYHIAAVNMSLGGGLFTSPCDSNSMKAVIDQLRTAGIATIVASGNDGSATALSSPACISTAISVGSTTDGRFKPADQVSSFTNANQYLSLLAPGEAIVSSIPGTGFGYLSGTSMAAPHVAGAWALMKSKLPSASVTDVLNAFIESSTSIADPRNGLAQPRIDVAAALGATATPCGYIVSPNRITVGAQAGTVTVDITTTSADCPWSARAVSPFVVIADSRSGTGPGSVVLTYLANASPSARDGVVAIADTVVTISQRAPRVATGDISGDGRADILWQNLADGSLATWWLDGSNVVGTYALDTCVSDPDWRVVGTGDLDGDGNPDLVWRHQAAGWLAVWYLAGSDVRRTELLSIDRVADLNWQIKGVDDVDGDGKADLIWQHQTAGWLAAWLMNGSQVVSTQLLSIDRVPDTQWQIAGAGDANGDGYADLIWQHRTGGWLAVWYLHGTTVTGTELLSINRIPDTAWQVRGVGDVDGDSHADIIWQNDETGDLGVWRLNGSIVVDQRSLSIGRVADLNWRVVGPG